MKNLLEAIEIVTEVTQEQINEGNLDLAQNLLDANKILLSAQSELQERAEPTPDLLDEIFHGFNNTFKLEDLDIKGNK